MLSRTLKVVSGLALCAVACFGIVAYSQSKKATGRKNGKPVSKMQKAAQKPVSAALKAEIRDCYLQMAQAFIAKKPDDVFAMWAEDFSIGGDKPFQYKSGNYDAEDKTLKKLTRDQAQERLLRHFPGNKSGAPSEHYLPRSYTNPALNKVVVEILMYQIVDNGCGYSLVSHTWIKPSDDSTWKLKEQRYVPRKGKDQDHYDADSKEWNKKVAQTIMVKWY